MQVNILCKNIDETDELAKKFARLIEDKGAFVCLYGDVGAGKTSLIKEYVRLCGIYDYVTSPTFGLMHEYDNQIFHYDLYNREISDLLHLGILDLLENTGVHFIEWANNELKSILNDAFSNIITIKIDKSLESRNYEIS